MRRDWREGEAVSAQAEDRDWHASTCVCAVCEYRRGRAEGAAAERRRIRRRLLRTRTYESAVALFDGLEAATRAPRKGKRGA